MRYIPLLSSIVVLFVGVSMPVFAGEYQDAAKGISFHYPDSVAIDPTNSQDEPFRLAFSHGEPPFNVSVLFRAAKGDSLEAFIEKERQDQEKSQYAGDVTEKKYDLANGLYAVEFIRDTPRAKIYYFVFPSPKTGKLYAFWHMTSEVGDPEHVVLDAYHKMVETLSITE